ncbi:MAG: hypothetical protein PWQ77_385 [Kosmotogales bacterium]|jgi:hypothetical protein|nr:hypothetical protein [Kosmotogales bacterium]
MLIALNDIVHILYFVMVGFFAIFLIKQFFKREKKRGMVYDIVYAYVIMVFLLRLFYIK